MLVTTPVTILKTYDYSETSLILRCLTRDHGLRSVIAKGARRPKSRFGGLVEPFSDGIATFYLKDGRDLYTLSSFELTRERQALGRDLVRFAGAGLLTELALRFASASEERRLFDGLRRGLDRLIEEPGDPAALVLREAWGMITTLGFRPAATRCVSCGRVLADSDATLFEVDAGGLLCPRCAGRAASRGRALELTAVAGCELRALTAPVRNGAERVKPTQALRTGRLQRAILREFVVHHLADDRPLNSLTFLERQLG
jgi:DNA repair protein RecO (recombination protein O)